MNMNEFNILIQYRRVPGSSAWAYQFTVDSKVPLTAQEVIQALDQIVRDIKEGKFETHQNVNMKQ